MCKSLLGGFLALKRAVVVLMFLRDKQSKLLGADSFQSQYSSQYFDIHTWLYPQVYL